MAHEIRRGTVADCDFLGVAIRDAERAHGNRGLWDLLLPYSDHEIATILSKSCLLPSSCYYYERFLILWDNDLNKPMAAACGFCYPQISVSQTIDLVMNILKEEYQWTDQQVEEGLQRLSVLDGAFPTNVNWEDGLTWLIEAVYTVPEYRRKGLGKIIITAVRSMNSSPESCPRCWITCSLGNDPAFHLYQSVGFHLIGDANSVNTNTELKFHVLEYRYPDPSVPPQEEK